MEKKEKSTPAGCGENYGLANKKKVQQFKGEADNPCNDCPNNRKIPIVPLLLGFIVGSLFGKLIGLLLAVIGIL